MTSEEYIFGRVIDEAAPVGVPFASVVLLLNGEIVPGYGTVTDFFGKFELNIEGYYDGAEGASSIDVQVTSIQFKPAIFEQLAPQHKTEEEPIEEWWYNENVLEMQKKTHVLDEAVIVAEPSQAGFGILPLIVLLLVVLSDQD